MLSNEIIEAYLCPMGFKTTVVTHLVEDGINKYELLIEGVNAKRSATKAKFWLHLPIFAAGSDRILQVIGATGLRYRVVINLGIQDVNNPDELSIRSWQAVVVDELNSLISGSIMDWFFGNKTQCQTIIHQRVSHWFNTSPYIMDVDPERPIQEQSILETIRIKVYDENMSHNGRVFPDSWLGYLDPCSTPSSDHINMVYRLCKGVTISGGKLVKQEDGPVHCSAIEDNAIATILNPRRSYLLRAHFEQHEKIIFEEPPIIQPKNNKLSGIHLRTAIMHLGANTFEDCIAISASAAAKLGAVVTKVETIISQSPLHMKIKEGDFIEPDSIIAENDEGMPFRATKIYKTGKVYSLTLINTIYQGYPAYVAKLRIGCIYPLRTGDKLSTRGATKGVVKVIPENNMPMDEEGRRIDVCIGPEAIYGRRSMLVYWEMMAHAYIKDGGTVNADLMNPTPTFQELVDKGYGKARQLMLFGRSLEEKTFCGDIFFIRLNKHACETISYKGERRIVNQYGLMPDDARAAGQRIDLAKLIAMKARGLDKTIKYIVQKNTEGQERTRSLFRCLVDKQALEKMFKEISELEAAKESAEAN